jgi:hypothetical protein
MQNGTVLCRHCTGFAQGIPKGKIMVIADIRLPGGMAVCTEEKRLGWIVPSVPVARNMDIPPLTTANYLIDLYKEVNNENAHACQDSKL